ncbi:nitrilase-related carbon-nitrogen hydrolase [Nonomuraea sp. NPDC050310]|uniref:nitrilase-related carbon-nitrogen hydrolase n=1 Tax=unclassified Nonomuraea TaxID=2593643 RepID=UPI003403E2BF
MVSRLSLPLAATASAVLFFFGTGLTPVPALTWLAPLPLLLVAPRVGGWSAAGAAFLAYLLAQGNQLHFYLNTPSVPFPVALVIMTGSALLFALVVALFRALMVRGRAVLAVLAAPALWVALGHLYLMTSPVGILWPLAGTQADLPAVIQIASVAGSWSVEYLVLLVPAALASLRPRAIAVGAVLCAAAVGFGLVRLAEPATGGRQVALLVAGRFQWAPQLDEPDAQNRLRGYAERIAALPASVETVVLPEAAFATRPDDRAVLDRALGTLGRTVVVGVIHKTPEAKYNQVLAYAGDGSAPAVYTKWHVAPGAGLVAGRDLVYAAGGTIGLANCMDLNFADPARSYGLAGAGLLAVPAADEFGNGWQHSRSGLLRGVESGVAIAWAAQKGTPMISDGYGRVLAGGDTENTREDFVLTTATVPAGPGKTPYARFGDWFAWLCTALSVGAVLSLRRRPGPDAASEVRRSDPAVASAR